MESVAGPPLQRTWACALLPARLPRPATRFQRTAHDRQRTGVLQLSQTICVLDQTTHQNTALVQEGAAAAALREQAQRLAESVRTFRVADSVQG
jgi:hypothetical protein